MTTNLQTIHTHAAAVPCGIAPLRDGIRDVLGLRSDGQMARIDAVRVIAGMEHDAPRRDGASISQFPSDSWGVASDVLLPVPADVDLSTASRGDAAPCPRPAFVWASSLDLLPEASRQIRLRVRFRRVNFTYNIRPKAIRWGIATIGLCAPALIVQIQTHLRHTHQRFEAHAGLLAHVLGSLRPRAVRSRLSSGVQALRDAQEQCGVPLVQAERGPPRLQRRVGSDFFHDGMVGLYVRS